MTSLGKHFFGYYAILEEDYSQSFAFIHSRLWHILSSMSFCSGVNVTFSAIILLGQFLLGEFEL